MSIAAPATPAAVAAVENPANPITKVDFVHLREALAKAKEAADIAEAASNDGGTCNFDTAFVHLPRVRFDKVADAAPVDVTVSKRGAGLFYFGTRTRQGNAQTAAARAFCNAMRSAGYTAYVHYAMD